MYGLRRPGASLPRSDLNVDPTPSADLVFSDRFTFSNALLHTFVSSLCSAPFHNPQPEDLHIGA
jgi:hypothetical protein